MRLRYALPLYCLAGMLAGIALSPFASHTLTTVALGAFGGALLLILRNVRQEVSASERRIATNLFSMLPQMHAMMEISKRIDLRAPLPPLRGWAVSYDFAATLVSILLERKPTVVVEASSGVSTILTGYCLEKNGGRAISLDHEAKYADATNDGVGLHNLGRYAQAFHAPLRPYTLSGREYLWYDMSALESLDAPIEVAVIDGPPANNQPDARYPALPLLMSRLSPDAVVVVDDADRPGEREMIRRWIEEYPEFSVQFLPHEKGTAVLRRRHSHADLFSGSAPAYGRGSE